MTGRTCIVACSPRRPSQSRRVADELRRLIGSMEPAWEVDLLDLAEGEVAIWSERLLEPEHHESRRWGVISTRLSACSSFIFVVPEWSGMAPPQAKNLFLMCDAGELAHKPALLVAVAAGEGGAYPIAELRASSYKNTRVCYLPDHLIFRNLGADPDPDTLAGVQPRALYTLGLLMAYDRALLGLRNSGHVDLDSFPFGQ